MMISSVVCRIIYTIAALKLLYACYSYILGSLKVLQDKLILAITMCFKYKCNPILLEEVSNTCNNSLLACS